MSLFLPLERVHVRQCIEFQIDTAIKETLQGEKYTQPELRKIKSQMTNKVDNILQEMTFDSAYSTTGCKRVGPKVDILLEDILLDVT